MTNAFAEKTGAPALYIWQRKIVRNETESQGPSFTRFINLSCHGVQATRILAKITYLYTVISCIFSRLPKKVRIYLVSTKNLCYLGS